MDEKQRIELMKLTSARYLDGRARDIYKRKLDQLMGAMQAASHGESPRAAEGLPTPWLGVLERVNVYGSLLWVLVFAAVLLLSQGGQRPRIAAIADRLWVNWV